MMYNYILQKTTSYRQAMPQCSLLKLMATYVSERPMSEMVGAMVRGPINCMRTPTSPVQPRNSCVRLATIRLPWICKCIVPKNIELLLFLYNSFVRVIRLIINRKYGVFCIYYVRLSHDNHNLIHWIKNDHVLLKMIMIMIDSWWTIHWLFGEITVCLYCNGKHYTIVFNICIKITRHTQLKQVGKAHYHLINLFIQLLQIMWMFSVLAAYVSYCMRA